MFQVFEQRSGENEQSESKHVHRYDLSSEVDLSKQQLTCSQSQGILVSCIIVQSSTSVSYIFLAPRHTFMHGS